MSAPMFSRSIALFALLWSWLLPTTAWAQNTLDGSRWLDVETGQSLIWRGEEPISRVLVSDSQVAEVKLLEKEQFQIRGLMVGSTDLWVWYREKPDEPVSYEIVVHQDLSELVRRVAAAVGGSPPRIYPLKGRLVVDGTVDDVETLERVAALASVYDPQFVNLLSVRGDHQVQLHVLFAEVSRTGLRELGINYLFDSPSVLGGMYGPNAGDSHTLAFTDSAGQDREYDWFFPTTGAFQVLGVVQVGDLLLNSYLGALEESNLSKVLAEPTLVALSGQQAEFLAGGEVPIAITTADQIKIEFKEYGIKLVFVPTVLAGEVIDLRVYTEVSEIDRNVAISVGGLAIPGFASRKGSSHLRLENGKTFAMAGLLSEKELYTRDAVPLLGEIPILGALFRYIRHEREETEIMIFVTPRLVRPMDPSEVPPPPTAVEDNNPNDFELFLLGKDHRSGSRDPASIGPVGMER